MISRSAFEIIIELLDTTLPSPIPPIATKAFFIFTPALFSASFNAFLILCDIS